MLAHYVRRGTRASTPRSWTRAKEDGTDPHSWMRTEIVGEDIIGKGERGTGQRQDGHLRLPLRGRRREARGDRAPHGLGHREARAGQGDQGQAIREVHRPGQAQDAIEEAVEAKGFLLGLDGRKLNVRKAHAALNTLLQSAGRYRYEKDADRIGRRAKGVGLSPGTDYEFVANIHDEAQAEVLPEHYPTYQRLALEAHPKAGKLLRVLCPLKAEVSPLAHSWKETH
jgi:hypothetical protein